MSRKFWFLSSLGLLGGVIIFITLLEDTVDIELKDDMVYAPKVSVVNSDIAKHAGVIKTFSEIKPRWSAEIKSKVNGDIINIAKNAMAGEVVTKGDVLIEIEDSSYKAELADVQKSLADAKLALLQEEKKTEQALRNWKRSGLKTKPSDLALNKPQLEIAKKAVQAALEKVTSAETNYAYTKVKAPFNGVITKRFANLGQSINIGDSLVHILSQEKLDITASVSPKQWKTINKNFLESIAIVKDEDNNILAHAKIRQAGTFIDPKTRQYQVFLEVEQNLQANVTAGKFVRVELAGQAVDKTLLIPENSLTREGIIWYVDNNDTLRHFSSEIIFYQEGKLIVTAPKLVNEESLQIVLSPLASFMAGKKVTPILAEGN